MTAGQVINSTCKLMSYTKIFKNDYSTSRLVTNPNGYETLSFTKQDLIIPLMLIRQQRCIVNAPIVCKTNFFLKLLTQHANFVWTSISLRSSTSFKTINNQISTYFCTYPVGEIFCFWPTFIQWMKISFTQ